MNAEKNLSATFVTFGLFVKIVQKQDTGKIVLHIISVFIVRLKFNTNMM